MSLTTDVCIAGGGPAGVMLGMLLARGGLDVVVLEKHDDFFRDFRGDTVHPSTLDLIDQLGIRDAFEAIPHAPLPRLDVVASGIRVHLLDFGTLPGPNRAITLMPQWDLLDLLARTGAESGGFRMLMGTRATGVRRAGGRVTGVTAEGPNGPVEIEARITVAADGRDSAVREALGLAPVSFGVPIDVLWFRLPKPARPVPDTLFWLDADTTLVSFPRPDYLQCGLLIPKGAFPRIEADGIHRLRAAIARVAPRLAEVADGLVGFDDVHLLSVQLNRLERWWMPGALCIGDAAHAMSPVFGVGVNYAIQDAVATANLLVPAFREGRTSPAELDALLARVQARRLRPTALMQNAQRVVHRVVTQPRPAELLHRPPTLAERTLLRLAVPIVRRVGARLVGYGFRPERIDDAVLSVVE